MVSENKLDGGALPRPLAVGAITETRQIKLRWLVMLLGALGVAMAINQQFLLNIFGFQPLGNAYLYYLIGIFLAVSFITLPISKSLDGRFLLLNLVLAVAAIVSAGWLSKRADNHPAGMGTRRAVDCRRYGDDPVLSRS